MTTVAKLSHNRNITIRQFNSGERTIEVAIRGEHVFSASRRFGHWYLGNITTPDKMSLSELDEFTRAMHDANEYISNLSK